MNYLAAVGIPGAQTVVLKYHFPLKGKVELNRKVAITKSSQWVLKSQMTGFYNR